MLVYRLGDGAYAHDLKGEGARLFGGRWNHIGIPCLYTSSSRSLAVLEYSVNVNLSRILRNLKIALIDIPNDIKTVSISELPGDWQDAPAPTSTQDFGTKFLAGFSHLVLRVPSTIIPQEFNYLINPRHELINDSKVVNVQDFIYDLRIKMA